jgi:hypothetical protein
LQEDDAAVTVGGLERCRQAKKSPAVPGEGERFSECWCCYLLFLFSQING